MVFFVITQLSFSFLPFIFHLIPFLFLSLFLCVSVGFLCLFHFFFLGLRYFYACFECYEKKSSQDNRVNKIWIILIQKKNLIDDKQFLDLKCFHPSLSICFAYPSIDLSLSLCLLLYFIISFFWLLYSSTVYWNLLKLFSIVNFYRYSIYLPYLVYNLFKFLLWKTRSNIFNFLQN